MYEHRSEQLLPRRLFVGRMIRSGAIAAAVVIVWLFLGTVGYHSLAGFSWIDSILNASMILSGMGPVDPLKTDASKLFASAYAIFSGVVFLSVAAVLIAPLLHRLMHHFHVTGRQN